MLNKIYNLIKQKSLINFFSILLILGITIFISLPEKSQTIGKRHQDLIAHQLITFNLWNQYGFCNYKGGLILTYPNPGDFNLKADPIQTGKNDKGEYFYFSYPPFSFYSTYFLLKIFHLPINEYAIRWIASCFLFINVGIFFLIFKENSIIPITSYLFLPNVLWFHHNVWFLDIQVITFILSAIYFSNKNIFLFLIFIFFACLTEWWGFLFTFCFLAFTKIYEFYNQPVHNLIYKNLKYQFLTIIVAMGAFLIFMLINVEIVGFNEFFNGLYERFLNRTGINVKPVDYFNLSMKETYIFIIWYYLRNYLAIFLLLSIFYWFLRNKNWNKYLQFSVLVIFVSILLHHLILLNWTAAHDFSVLKFSIIIPFLTHFIWINLNSHQKNVFLLGILFVTFLNLFQYYRHINVPRNTQYLEIAHCIKQEFNPNQIAKANYYHQPLPYLWWKSERNVMRDSIDTKCK